MTERAMDRALVRNAADAKQVQRATQQEKRSRDLRASRTVAIMSTYDGRWWMWDHLADLGPFRSIFVTSSEIYYRAGKQDAAHELIAHLTTVCPDLFVQMQRENIERQKTALPDPAPQTADAPNNDEDDDAN